MCVAWWCGIAAVVAGGIPLQEPRGIAFSIHLPGEVASIAHVRIDRIHGDRQTRGFFKIGVFPLLVAEGVRIECKDPARLAEVLVETGRGIPGQGARGFVEFRRLSVFFPDDEGPRLEAGHVAFPSPDAWQLGSGVRWQVPGGVVGQSENAVLRIGGRDAGWVAGHSGTNSFRIYLLQSFRPSPNPKSTP